jgi:hypothetical protein
MQRSEARSSKITVYNKILSYRKEERKGKERKERKGKERKRVSLDFYSTGVDPCMTIN